MATPLASRSGLRLVRLLGIEIRLDWSVLIVFWLVVASFGAGQLVIWHPGWSLGLRWGTAIAAGVLFFVSLLLHELAHSLVARAWGIPVPRITLFLFGGVSEMEGEPETPGQELGIAVVGPLTSLVLGVAFTLLGWSMVGPTFADQVVDQPAGAMSHLGVLPTLMLWLGPVNLALGVFNLVPGFPLDGGRVLRAGLWWWTGDLMSATRWASRAGQGFAAVLIALGVLQALGGSLGGLWLVLIGWFLNNAARNSHLQMLLRHALEDLRVGDLMRTRFEEVGPELPLQRFIDDYLLRGAQVAWPVVDHGRPVGLLGVDEVAAVPEDQRGGLSVGDAMAELADQVSPELGGREALERLVVSRHDPLLVVEDEHVVGLLYRGDIMRWLAVHQLQAG